MNVVGEMIQDCFEHIRLVVHNSVIATALLDTTGLNTPATYPLNSRLLCVGIIVGNLALTLLCLLTTWKLRQLQPAIAQWTAQLNTLDTDLKHSLAQATQSIQTNRQALQARHRHNRQQHTRLQTYLQYIQWSRYLLIILRWSRFQWRESGKVSL
ncbi:MAG: hypothetical protein F6K09_04885 [Merismopedia sp. SIO2A8]|nr:hypothetical protein [Merismopedia sp. SIO2A8]